MLKQTMLIFALATAAPLAAQPLTPVERAAIDAAVTEALGETSTPSASIAVVRDGKIVLTEAYGKASETLRAAPELPYQIASISKQFTAMALLLLEDEGKLSLDDKVAKYLPDISGGDRITLRQLLSHTSGLQDYWPQDFSFAAMQKATTPQGIVDRWAKKPLDFQPGDQWQYSNTGYVIAGMIAEKVSGKPLMQLFQERLFKPLNMTSVLSQDDAIGSKYPSGYGRYALGPMRVVTPPARGWLWSAAELSMTAEDLAKWDIARINRSVLPAEDWKEQETTIKLNDGKDTAYGLGVYATNASGRYTVSHGGEAVGFLAANYVYQNDRAAVVVLTNTWSSDAHARIAQAVSKIVLPAADQGKSDVTAQLVKTVYEQLRTGTLDRSLLTPNADYYFTRQAVADYQTSLQPLGAPTSFEQGKSALRGGFETYGYTVRYPNRTLNLSVFKEPGPQGRIEQFLITPGK